MRSGKSGVPSNLSSRSLTMRRIRSETSTWWTPSRKRPSKRSGSSRARKSWKSSSLPLCGVAVISKKWRGRGPGRWPRAEAALKAVGIQQGQKELEIFFLAVVRRGCHQQEVAGKGAEQLAEAVALGIFNLAAKEGRGKLMGFIADHQIPAGVGRLELLLD